MIFAPKPENDFAHYIETYYVKCRSYFDGIEAIAGKWMFRDLIPGMSDFDTRFIVRDGMTPRDWCQMSMAVGEAHLALCDKYPCWARNLEHLPGINLTWSELTSEKNYYPECQQWTFYRSEHPAKINSAVDWLANRPWDKKDEYFHLKKFCTYYGRYNRSIDPAINLGVHESKYPLHSRIMHYFIPAVQAVVSLLEKRGIVGKFDALEMAQRNFPDLTCWNPVNEILQANYVAPRWYREPSVSHLEDMFELALREMAVKARPTLTLIPRELGLDVTEWQRELQAVRIEPTLLISETTRFSRLMKGRLYFYAQAPAHFETSWLIAHELKRIGKNFFHIPFAAYWELRTGQVITDATSILEDLCGELLTPEEAAAAREFARLTEGLWRQGEEKQVALSIAHVFDSFFEGLTKVSDAVYDLNAGLAVPGKARG